MYFPTMCLTVLCWNILSVVTSNSTIMVFASVILIYPFFLVDYVQIVFSNLDISDVPKILSPFTVYTYPIILGLISLYLALLFTQNEEGVSYLFSDKIKRLNAKNLENDTTFSQYLSSFWEVVMGPLESVFRYFTLMIAILTALFSISILSAILVFFAFIFIWKEGLDLKYWKWFTGYTIMHVLTKQLGHYLVDAHNYNIENMAMVGIISVEKEASSPYSLRVLMLLDFFLIFLCCSWYSRVQFREQQAAFKKQNELIKGIQDLAITHVNITILKILRAAYTFVTMIMKYYAIWIYHAAANLVLLNEPRDIVTIVMLLLECITTVVHFTIWKKTGVHPYKAVYRVWSPNFYFLVLYALTRYLTFFLQYIHARDIYVTGLSMVGFDGQKIVNEKLQALDQINKYTYQYYVKSYLRLLILVSVAVFTRNSLKSVIFANDQDAEEKLNNLMKNSNSKTTKEVLASTEKAFPKQARSSIRTSDPFGLSGSIILQRFLHIEHRG